MLDLVRLSFQALPYAIAFPWLWGSLGITAGGALWLQDRQPPPATDARSLELLLPNVFPVLILAWGSALYGSLENKPDGLYWQLVGVYALLLAQPIVSVWLLSRHRSRMTSAVLVSMFAAWWASAASHIALMALANDWP